MAMASRRDPAASKRNYPRKTKAQLVEEIERLECRLHAVESVRAHGNVNTDATAPVTPDLRHIYKVMPTGLCYFDTNLRYLLINDWLANLNGMTADEHLGRTVGQVLPDVAAGAESQLRQVIQSGEPILGGTVEAETPAQPGVKRTFQHNYYPVRSDDGTIVGVSCVVEDITERKNAEEDLKEKTAVLQVILDTMDQGISVVDANLNVIASNKKLLEMLEFPPDFGAGTSFEEYVRYNAERGEYGPGDIKELVKERVELAKQFKPHRFERVRPDGTVIEIRDNPSAGGGFVTIYTDITERKRAEAEMIRQKTLFESIFESSPDAIVVSDPERNIILANAVVTRMYGYEVDEILGKSIQEFYENKAEFERLGAERFGPSADRIIPLAETRHRRKSGEVFPVEVSGAKLEDADGHHIGFIGVARDITERKAAEARASKSHDRLTDAVDSISEGFVLYDADERLILCNSTYRQMYPQIDELLVPGAKLEDIVRAAYARGAVNGTVGDVEEWVQRRVAHYRSCEGTIEHTLSDGRGVLSRERKTREGGVVGIRTDITELKAREERFQKYFELPLVGSAIYAPDKTWIEVNDTMCEILGYSREELTELNWADVTHPDDLAENVRLFDEAVADKHDTYSMDKRFIRKDGRVVHARISVQCLRKADGSPDYFILLLQDITERKAAEAAFRQSQKVESLGVMAGGLAHDINNMLMPILLMTSLALEDVPEGSRTHTYLTKVLTATRRATDTVKQLLAFSRAETPERQSLEFREVLEEAIQLIHSTLPATITIETDFSNAAGQVLTNPTQIQQVLLNLASNAADAMEDRGVLTISLERVEANTKSGIPVIEARPHLMLKVRDTGPGISADQIERIFDPFFTTKPVGKGTGLGLSVVHGILTDHGGTIHVAGEPGEGAEFSLFFPVFQDDHNTASAECEQLEPAGKAPREKRRTAKTPKRKSARAPNRKQSNRLAAQP